MEDINLDKVWSSLKSAQLYDYVNNSSDKLDTSNFNKTKNRKNYYFNFIQRKLIN